MSKAVLLSIHPKYCELISDGEKTVEVRKTRPKLETQFKCYIYCTMPKKHFSVGGGLTFSSDDLYRSASGKIKYGDSLELMCYDGCTKDNFLNGKVIGEFVCDNIDRYTDEVVNSSSLENFCGWNDFDLNRACIHPDDLEKYADGKDLYGWHISDLVIYDKPKELGEFLAEGRQTYDCPILTPLKRPPQSWCYVEELT